MKIRFFKTGDINGSSYVKNPLGSNAILNIGKNDNYCFLWSKSTYLHPCEGGYLSTIRNIYNVSMN